MEVWTSWDSFKHNNRDSGIEIFSKFIEIGQNYVILRKCECFMVSLVNWNYTLGWRLDEKRSRFVFDTMFVKFGFKMNRKLKNFSLYGSRAKTNNISNFEGSTLTIWNTILIIFRHSIT